MFCNFLIGRLVSLGLGDQILRLISGGIPLVYGNLALWGEAIMGLKDMVEAVMPLKYSEDLYFSKRFFNLEAIKEEK